MAIIQSNWAKGIIAIPYASFAGVVVAQRFVISVTAAQLLLNNIFELAPIPIGHVPLDMVLDTDDLDTNAAPTLTLDVGVMSGVWGDPDQARTVGAEFFAASNVAQAGGIARPTLKTAQRVAASQTARSIGVKVAAAPATAAPGDIGLTVFYATQ